jgi:hypothetical protein
VNLESRASMAIFTVAILILSLAIVAMVGPLLKSISFPALGSGVAQSGPGLGQLVVTVDLSSPTGEAGLAGVSFVIGSAIGRVASQYVTNDTGSFVAFLPPGNYSISSSDSRFYAGAQFSIAAGNVTTFFVLVTQTQMVPAFYDAIDADSSGFLDESEALYASFPSTDSPLNSSYAVTLVYSNPLANPGFSSLNTTVTSALNTTVSSVRSVSASVIGSEVRGDFLYAEFSPSATVPLAGFELLWVSSYSVFDMVSFGGG